MPHQIPLYPRMSLQEYSSFFKFKQSSPMLLLTMISTELSWKHKWDISDAGQPPTEQHRKPMQAFNI